MLSADAALGAHNASWVVFSDFPTGSIVQCGRKIKIPQQHEKRINTRLFVWFQELDLEQKIELEIKMREGSAKLLAASKQQAQSLEAARALLTSNERMSAYMAELQRRKRDPQIR